MLFFTCIKNDLESLGNINFYWMIVLLCKKDNIIINKYDKYIDEFLLLLSLDNLIFFLNV